VNGVVLRLGEEEALFMELTSDNLAFELRIVGYQFPDEQTADYDSNWLLVEGAVQHPRGDWRFRDPSMLTYEVAKLADWLEAAADGTEPEPWCAFIEPNLSFEVVGEGADRALRVSFAIEALPHWAKPGEEVYIDFPFSDLDLPTAVASLRQQLSAFPQRAER
jgi:hypothetical protein